MRVSLGFSPCPNDCFMFDAIVNRRIDLEGLEFSVRLADVEALNKAAFAREADVTKLSYHAFAYCAADYVLLDAGSALGRNCGPLLISKRAISTAEVAAGRLRIAIPGRYTTANCLLGLAFPAARDRTELVFSAIEPALLDDEFDAGLIIHENRFTYAAKGLRKIVDLGEFWESETGAPIPLGGIVVRRSLPDAVKHTVNRVLRRSVEFAFAHREASLPFVREHAQEMSDERDVPPHRSVRERVLDRSRPGRPSCREPVVRSGQRGRRPARCSRRPVPALSRRENGARLAMRRRAPHVAGGRRASSGSNALDDLAQLPHALGQRGGAGLQDEHRLDLADRAGADGGHLIPAGPGGDGVRPHGLAAPRGDDHFGVSPNDLLRGHDAVLSELGVTKLREDRIAAGDLDELLDPLDAGDQRLVPFLEIHTRSPRRTGRGRRARGRGPRSNRAARPSARSAQPTSPPSIRIICRISATLRWLKTTTL